LAAHEPIPAKILNVTTFPDPTCIGVYRLCGGGHTKLEYENEDGSRAIFFHGNQWILSVEGKNKFYADGPEDLYPGESLRWRRLESGQDVVATMLLTCDREKLVEQHRFIRRCEAMAAKLEKRLDVMKRHVMGFGCPGRGKSMILSAMARSLQALDHTLAQCDQGLFPHSNYSPGSGHTKALHMQEIGNYLLADTPGLGDITPQTCEAARDACMQVLSLGGLLTVICVVKINSGRVDVADLKNIRWLVDLSQGMIKTFTVVLNRLTSAEMQKLSDPVAMAILVNSFQISGLHPANVIALEENPDWAQNRCTPLSPILFRQLQNLPSNVIDGSKMMRVVPRNGSDDVKQLQELKHRIDEEQKEIQDTGKLTNKDKHDLKKRVGETYNQKEDCRIKESWAAQSDLANKLLDQEAKADKELEQRRQALQGAELAAIKRVQEHAEPRDEKRAKLSLEVEVGNTAFINKVVGRATGSSLPMDLSEYKLEEMKSSKQEELKEVKVTSKMPTSLLESGWRNMNASNQGRAVKHWSFG